MKGLKQEVSLENSIIFQDIEEIFHRNIDWEQLRDSTILVTGPNGMLASYVMYMLIYLNDEHDMGIRIIAMPRSTERFYDRFADYGRREYISVVTDSIMEPIRLTSSVDYIIHAASLASPNYYGVCPVDVLGPNAIGTYNLLKIASDQKVKKFILFSSGEIYGSVQDVEFVTENDMGTVDSLDIRSCYCESKRMAETMCVAFGRQYDVPFNVLRIWHTYSPTMDINRDPRVFASFMKNIVEGQDIEIKSDGSGKRAFCYVADAIAGLFMVLTKGENGEAYNICNTEQFISVKELAETLAKLRDDTDIKVKCKQRDKNENYLENTTIRQIAPSDRKLRGLGWSPKYDVGTGFERVWSYLRDQK